MSLDVPFHRVTNRQMMMVGKSMFATSIVLLRHNIVQRRSKGGQTNIPVSLIVYHTTALLETLYDPGGFV